MLSAEPRGARGRRSHAGGVRRRTVAAWVALVTGAVLTGEAAAQEAAPAPQDLPVRTDPLAETFVPVPGGLTPQIVARAASRENDTLRLRRAELAAASARLELAMLAYVPRVTLSASYTRIADIENIVRSEPCPDDPTLQCQVPAGDERSGLIPPTRVASIPDVWSLDGRVVVPISDYFLRFPHAVAAARAVEEAAELDAMAAETRAGSDAQLVFFTFMHAKAQKAVADDAIRSAQRRSRDVKELIAVGRGSPTDQLRFEAQLANDERLASEAASLLHLAEAELRRIVGKAKDAPLPLGVGLPEPHEDVATRRTTARDDVRALEALERAADAEVAVARAAYFPRLDGIADVTYANPNGRFVPLRDEWNASWSLGMRLTWSVNDTLEAGANVDLARARGQIAAVQRSALRRTLAREVEESEAALGRHREAVASATRGAAAAEALLRNTEELYRLGRASAADVVDVQIELTRARLVRVDAQIAWMVAKARRDRATGAEVR